MRKDTGGEEPPFRRLLVANRGEIAVRVIRACRELGIEAVAVYSDADAGALHVRLADEAVRLGPAPSVESYLLGDAIVAAALATRCEAVHPGYGFLAERASFARAVEQAGLAFVGPTSDSIAELGDKLAARRAAIAADVPVVPGTLAPVTVDGPAALDGIVSEAIGIGFPLLVKAAAGGGGRGMRRVEHVHELATAVAAGSAEALSAFGDGAVYLEREVQGARHIEVQLLGDADGTIVALGERDCSLQRRHQKLVEESPAPGLTGVERETLHAMAVRAARAARLRNAATAEFLFDGDRRFWFLEVNARLQVEHGVTELVADIDLVREQLRIAAGRPLAARVLAAAADAARPVRHAVEVRLSAEDPSRAFAPTPGRVGRWVMPAGPGVRVDSGAEPGVTVPPDYDPLLAKIMVVAPDRDEAIDRLRRALDEVEVTGIQTNLPFHRFVARHEGFRQGDVSIDWVDRHWDGERERAAAARDAQAAAALIVAEQGGSAGLGAGAAGSGRTGLGGWRAAARETMVDRWPR